MKQIEPSQFPIDSYQRKVMIAKIIKELRISYGFTQKQVADYLGIKPNTYSGYESAKSELNAEMIVRLADLYNVSTDLILARGSEPERIENIPSIIEQMKMDALIGKPNKDTMLLIQGVSSLNNVLGEIKNIIEKNGKTE